MSRPAPRRSGLAGRSPVAPPTTAPPVQDTVTPPAPEAELKKAKVSFYQSTDRTARARGAHLNTMAREGSRSLSEFIDKAVMAEVERLEVQYNGGQPFLPVGTGEIPRGRPMGE